MSSALLFGFGIVYGVITVHLHDNHWITPVKLENTHYYDSWQYLGFWGLAGVALGNILPWLDSWREDGEGDQPKPSDESENEDRSPSWVAVARSVGAFVGIAFAMVRPLPIRIVLVLTRHSRSMLEISSGDSPGNLQLKPHSPSPSRTLSSGT